MSLHGPIIYLCGTDTGVGKTVLLGAMLAYLLDRAQQFSFFKPFESGAPRDSVFLCRMAGGGRFTPAAVNFYHFRAPLAPATAAARQGIRPNLAYVAARIRSEARRGHPVFVEGAGGLFAPLAGIKTNLDLIKRLKAQVLVVGRTGLGTLNHTRLTYERLRLEKIRVAGIVLCQITARCGLAEKTNPAVLRSLGLPLLGVMPRVQGWTPRVLARALPTRMKKWLKEIHGDPA
jgi:dethiobiotin synthetase